MYVRHGLNEAGNGALRSGCYDWHVMSKIPNTLVHEQLCPLSISALWWKSSLRCSRRNGPHCVIRLEGSPMGDHEILSLMRES